MLSVENGTMMADDPAYPDLPRQIVGHDPAADTAGADAMRAQLLGLCERDYHQMVRFVMRIGATLEQAEDAVQEAFTAAWKLQRDQPAQWEKIHNHAAWLRTVAARSYQRPPDRKRPPTTNRKITETLVGAAPDMWLPAQHDPIELSAQAMAVRQALQALPHDQRVLMAFLLDGFTVAEAARELAINEQRARDLVRKARATLKKQLARTMDEQREGRSDQ